MTLDFCWVGPIIYSNSVIYRYSTFGHWVHPGILEPPSEFLRYSRDFCLVLLESSFCYYATSLWNHLNLAHILSTTQSSAVPEFPVKLEAFVPPPNHILVCEGQDGPGA